MWTHQLDNGLDHLHAVFGVQLLGLGIGEAAIQQCDQRPMVAIAVDGFTFPVADAAFLVDVGRELLDGYTLLELDALLLPAVVALGCIF